MQQVSAPDLLRSLAFSASRRNFSHDESNHPPRVYQRALLARKFFPGISFPPLFSLAQHLRSVSCNLVLLRITLLRLSIRFQGEIPPAAARHVNKMN
jgi:hypothetical protein